MTKKRHNFLNDDFFCLHRFFQQFNSSLKKKKTSMGCMQGQYIGGRKVVMSRSALASLELYCHDMAHNCTVPQ